MEFELTWVDQSLVICRTNGTASVEGYREMLQALISQPEFRPGVDLVVDHRSVDVSALTAVEIEQIAGFRVELGKAAGRSVGVAGLDSPLRYGLARMFGAYTHSRAGIEISWFETLDDALRWLRPAE